MLSKLLSPFKFIPALLSGGQGLLIAGVVVVVALGVQELRVQSWKADAYQAQAEAAEVRVSNAKLTASIEKQNAQISRLEDVAQIYADQASLAFLREEKRGAERLAAIRTAPPGHKEMNRWLNVDFSQ